MAGIATGVARPGLDRSRTAAAPGRPVSVGYFNTRWLERSKESRWLHLWPPDSGWGRQATWGLSLPTRLPRSLVSHQKKIARSGDTHG
jgi:hypothetical protein